MALRAPRTPQPSAASTPKPSAATGASLPAQVEPPVTPPPPAIPQPAPATPPRPTPTAREPAKGSEADLVAHLRAEGPKAIATALGVTADAPQVGEYLECAVAYVSNRNGQQYANILKATPGSVVQAVAKLAALRLKLIEDQGLAFLTTRSIKDQATGEYIIVAVGTPGIRGMENVLKDEGIRYTVNSNAVRRQDHFKVVQGTVGNRTVEFTPNTQPDFTKPNDVIASYAVLTSESQQEIVVTKTLREPTVALAECVQIAKARAEQAGAKFDETAAKQQFKALVDERAKGRKGAKLPLEEVGIEIINPGYSGVVKAAEYRSLREALRIASRTWSKNETLSELITSGDESRATTPRRPVAVTEGEDEEEGQRV